ncbi:MAG: crotonase/enoyl-CoA hydratase family protein [Bradyrhizobiaceae bacterium]|nr:crotonase/enoyl-CoA hydratase family protein [Bradyrhizobiaceae bacterium]
MSVLVERNGPVTTVILSRAEARNAVDPATAKELYEAFLAFDADPDQHVAVLWGAGGAFCAGYDLKAASSLAGGALAALDFPEDDRAVQGPMGPSRLHLSKPVIAAVAGPAVAGGMELALWCDLRVMEESAYMGVYCRRWGVPLIDGGTVRLPRLVGRGRALDLVLTGRKVEAEECLKIGLCERVVPHGRSREEAEKLAHELARFPQECLRADRRSVWLQEGLEERAALRAEWKNSSPVFEQEGVAGAARFASGKGRGGDMQDI